MFASSSVNCVVIGQPGSTVSLSGYGPNRHLQLTASREIADIYAQSYTQPRTTSFHYNLDLVIPRLMEAAGSVDGLAVLDAGTG